MSVPPLGREIAMRNVMLVFVNNHTTINNDHDRIIIKMIVMGIRGKNIKVCSTGVPNTGCGYHGKSRVSASSSVLKLCSISGF